MKIYYLCALGLLAVSAFGADTNIQESESVFETEFNKRYGNEELEQNAAAALAEAEAQMNSQNEQFNAGASPYFEQLNIDSDVPKDIKAAEMEGYFTSNQTRAFGLFMPDESEWFTHPDLEELYQSRQSTPPSYDATALGYVTSVKNQQSCGSCAAFAATGAHETSMLSTGARFNGLDLSEQFLIDCGYNGLNMLGCNGADPGAYGQFFAGNLAGQSPHEFTYPYLNANPTLKCPTGLATYNSGAYVATALPDYYCTEDKLATLVSTYGAAVTSIYAGDTGFGNYAGGVFNGCTSQRRNHAVLVVGYGTDATSGMNYWLVKNSWGAGWGANGFIKIFRGNNQCGIGKFCYAAKSAQTTGPLSDPPPAPPAPIIPASQTCDVSQIWSPPLDGAGYTLYIPNQDDKTKPFVSTVDCVQGICKPHTAGPSNCCMYICGQLQCQ